MPGRPWPVDGTLLVLRPPSVLGLHHSLLLLDIVHCLGSLAPVSCQDSLGCCLHLSAWERVLPAGIEIMCAAAPSCRFAMELEEEGKKVFVRVNLPPLLIACVKAMPQWWW